MLADKGKEKPGAHSFFVSSIQKAGCRIVITQCHGIVFSGMFMPRKLVQRSCRSTLGTPVMLIVATGKATKSLPSSSADSFTDVVDQRFCERAMPYSPLLFCQKATVVALVLQKIVTRYSLSSCQSGFLLRPIIEHAVTESADTSNGARCVIKRFGNFHGLVPFMNMSTVLRFLIIKVSL